MNKNCKLSLLLFVTFIFPGFSTYAEDKPNFIESYSVTDSKVAAKEIAAILIHMEHFVVSHEKKMLKSISKNSKLSPNVRSLAKAVINIQHKPLHSDIEKMRDIYQNEHSPVAVQELAYIIMNFKYKPKDKDLAMLKEIVK